MALSKKQKKVVSEIKKVAESRYGEPKQRKVRPPLDQLVQSVLWRYTSIRRGTRGLRELKRTFVDWNEVRVSTVKETAAAMSNAQWAEDASAHIKKIIDGVFELRNVTTLDFLEDMTQAQAKTFLRSVQGVTRDLADELLLFNFDAKKLPLDDDGTRMAYRMGFLEDAKGTKKNQRAFREIWGREYFVGVTMFMHDHARDVCCPENPQHDKCPLKNVCPRVGV